MTRKAPGELELIEMQEDQTLQLKYKSTLITEFWTFVPESKYPELKKAACRIISIFGITYSTLKFVKYKHRSVLLRSAVTNYSSNFKELSREIAKMLTRIKCSVNLSLLPIKSHYFFFFGGIGGVMPFMPVVAKGLGINATAVGLIFTVLPFCVFFSKPLFGYVTDYFQNIKAVIFILVFVTALSYFLVIFLPSFENDINVPVNTRCLRENNSISISTQAYDQKCLNDLHQQDVEGELVFDTCDRNGSISLSGKVHIQKPGNESIYESLDSNSRGWLEFKPDTNFYCDCIDNNTSTFICSSIKSCLLIDSSVSIYRTYQFWIFAILAIISGAGATVAFTLSDSACYEVLGERPELYGRQRLWATISWGIVTLLVGFLNDIATGDSEVTNYAPGFYVMLVLVGIDLLLLLKIQLTKANLSLNIFKDVGKIFSSWDTICFAAAIYVMGAMSGILWGYQFWLLQDLGATQTLLGLCVAVQCLVAEVPFFFFSGWFIKIFGYFYCVSGSLAAFAIRYGLYYVLKNPWWVLPIEVLHGITFAVFYASMTGYASDYAPPGTEATMLGIFGGLFEGLGVATGSLLGGVGLDKLGGRETFLVAGCVSFVSAPVLALFHVVRNKYHGKAEVSNIK
ncbi:hypothetical protein TNCT_67221 [Trichonephila clavata]|uniref:Major facilitator superfamily associated domain-containing protein n=1 Tax=Trichonephila clavata TaxID=2740835 RepID=A0A8X6L2Z3_TRICU|nr:hypothetical protein TNCT_67221 [Trichonephila clavata]